MSVAHDLHQPLPGFWASLCDRLGDRLLGDRRRLYERFFAALTHFTRLATAENLSVVHGDAHVRNVFLANGWPRWRRAFVRLGRLAAQSASDRPCLHDGNLMVSRTPALRAVVARPLSRDPARLRVKGYDRALLDRDYRLAVLIQMTMPILINIGVPARHWMYSFERIKVAVDDPGCRDLLN